VSTIQFDNDYSLTPGVPAFPAHRNDPDSGRHLPHGDRTSIIRKRRRSIASRSIHSSVDRTPITNRQFKEFVKATGHITFAEFPRSEGLRGALPHMLYAGSLVFVPPSRQVDLRNWGEWWTFLKAPTGGTPMDQGATSQSRPSSGGARGRFAGCDRFTRRVGLARLGPTEEMECCARAGDRREYAWGRGIQRPGRQAPGHTWQGAISPTKWG